MAAPIELMRQLAEFAPLAVILVEADGETLRVSTASQLARELTGAVSVVGSKIDEVFPGKHFEHWEDDLRGITPGEQSVVSLIVDHLPYGRRWELDGSRTMWQVTTRRIDESRWLAFAIDLTGQYRYAEMLEDALAGKARAFETMGEVVHELRQPVTSIRGFASLLAEMGGDGQVTEFSQVIAEQALALDQLIDDLLTAGLQAAGRLKVETTRVSGEHLTDGIAALLRSFPDHEIQIEGTIATATVMADTRRVVQVVRGLVQNAIKYGGPHIAVRVTESDDTVAIDVTDDGAGLSPEDALDIFEPFSTGAAGASVSSTGIGLGIARSLVTDMGGMLEYLHEPPGAVFRITLPRSGSPSVVRLMNFDLERDRLVEELVSYESDGARHRLNRLALSQPPARIIEGAVRPAMYEVGERWLRGEISVAQEHHASAVVHGWLTGILAKYQPDRSEVVVCASAPGNQHEIGLLSVAVALAEAGYRVVYIGRSAPVESLVKTVADTGASALLLSLNTTGDLDGLRQVVKALHEKIRSGLLVGFGGRLFAHGFSDSDLPGVFIGDTPADAVAALERLSANA